MSQTDFAALAGAGRKTQFNYESDERYPDAEYLAAVALAGSDVRYIVTGDRDGPPPLKPDEQTLLDGYRALDPATRRRVLAFVFGGEPPSGDVQKIKSNKGQVTQSGDIAITKGGRKKR
jgi:transcriptional regulator with XRE-family HTH domain